MQEIPDRAALADAYERHRHGYEKALSSLHAEVARVLRAAGIRPTLKSRVKEFDSYYDKKIRLLRKAAVDSSAPLPVNDVLAIRAVCPFLGDVVTAERVLCAHFEVVEIERKGAERSFREFGYESVHLLITIPDRCAADCSGLERDVFEIQLRTILQEAWAEVEHELVYKAEFTPFDEPMKRKLAALNANLSLSDIIFQEILEYEKRLTRELSRRRSAFYAKIEDVADGPAILAASREEGGAADSCTDLSPDGSRASAHAGAGAAMKPGPGLGEEAAAGSPGRIAAGEPANPPGKGGKEAVAAAQPAGGNLPEPGLDMDGLLLAALEAHNSGDYSRAADCYGRIIARNPGKEVAAVVHKHRGMAFFARSLYRDAMADFSACLGLDPTCYKAAYYRGVVKSVLGDFHGAVEDYSLALEIHPYHFYSRYRRALAWWRLGDPAQCLADCEAALRTDPGNALVLQLRDQARMRMNAADF